MKSKAKIHYAWIILAILCLAQGAVIGIISNCIGLFFSPVSEDLGCALSESALASTMWTLAMCLFVTFFGKKVMMTFKTKYVFLVCNLLLLSRLGLCFIHSVVWWWILNFVSGIGGALFLGFATNIILERWFVKKLPTALSIVGSFSGIFGILMSYVIGRLITTVGWRNAMFVASVSVCVLIAPTFFVFLDPSEKGINPYGADENYVKPAPKENNGKPVRLKLTGRVWFCIVFAIINATLTAFIQHLSTYGISINLALDSSLLVTMYMIGNLVFKLLYGFSVEKLGLKLPSLVMLAIMGIGMIFMMTKNTLLCMVGALFFGASAAIYTAMVPLTTKKLFTSEEFPAISQIEFMPYNLIYALFGYLYGLVYDKFQSYLPIMIFILVANAIGFAMMLTIKPRTK